MEVQGRGVYLFVLAIFWLFISGECLNTEPLLAGHLWVVDHCQASSFCSLFSFLRAHFKIHPFKVSILTSNMNMNYL